MRHDKKARSDSINDNLLGSSPGLAAPLKQHCWEQTHSNQEGSSHTGTLGYADIVEHIREPSSNCQQLSPNTSCAEMIRTRMVQ